MKAQDLLELLESNDREVREIERERAAALVRAFAEARPAGEVPRLLRLADTIETGTVPDEGSCST